MARPTLKTNRKYQALLRRLARLGIGHATVRGLLEELWDSAHECGDPVFPNAEQVEAAAKWEGEPGTLTTELSELGFLDFLENGKLQIHDYWDHAPDYVRKRAAREAERVAKGKTLQQLRAEAGQKGGETRWQTDSKRKQIATTRTPTPTPLNINTPDSSKEEANGSHLLLTDTGTPQTALDATETANAQTPDRGGERQPGEAQGDAMAEEIYSAYPRHEAKKRAMEQIRLALTRHPAARVLAATRAYASQKRSTDKQYIPYAATWFAEERYLDQATPAIDQSNEARQAVIAEGNVEFKAGRTYNDVISSLVDKYGHEATHRAIRSQGWSRTNHPGSSHAITNAPIPPATRQHQDTHPSGAQQTRADDRAGHRENEMAQEQAAAHEIHHHHQPLAATSA